MKLESFVPKAPRMYQMTFTADEGWALVMALQDAYYKHDEAADRDQWLQWSADLNELLRTHR